MISISLETQKSKDRYPGLKPFIVEDRAIFFGRDVETESILQSISVNKAFIVWGKSGLGKSSLINAAVIPKLIEQKYLPLKIRFYNCKEDPISIIETEIRNNIQILENNRIINNKTDLNQLIRMLPENRKPIFIFDQFEEFFYYSSEKREQTINFLADLLNSNPNFDGEDASLILHKDGYRSIQDQQIVRLVFLIRSDRLNLMDEVALKIPGIFNNRFQLKPLFRESAEQSLELPAQISDTEGSTIGFRVSPFEYSDDALRVILQTLSGKNNEIESSQLQIVCQEFESIVEDVFARKNGRVLTPDDFRGQEGIKEILNGFYFKQIKRMKDDPELSLSDEDINKIKKLIESELISGSKRIIQSEERIKDQIRDSIRPGIEKIGIKNKEDAVIDKLLDLRLIREEESHLGKVYEISHDTLLESIIISRNERVKIEKDEKISEQKKLIEEANARSDVERKLKEKARNDREKAIKLQEKALLAEKEAKKAWELAVDNADKAKKSLVMSRVALGLALLFLTIAIFFLSSSTKQKNRFEEQKNRFKDLLVKNLLSSADKAYNDNNHRIAFLLAEQSDKITNSDTLNSLINQWSLSEYSWDIKTTKIFAYPPIIVSKKDSVEIIYIKDTVFCNNPIVRIKADDFFLSADGTCISIIKKSKVERGNSNSSMDTAKIYSINKNNFKLEFMDIAIYPSDMEVVLLINSHFILKNDTMVIVKVLDGIPESILTYKIKLKGTRRYATYNNKLILWDYSDRNNYYCFDKTNGFVWNKGFDYEPIYNYYYGNASLTTMTKVNFILNKKTGIVYKLGSENMIPVFKLNSKKIKSKGKYIYESRYFYYLDFETRTKLEGLLFPKKITDQPPLQFDSVKVILNSLDTLMLLRNDSIILISEDKLTRKKIWNQDNFAKGPFGEDLIYYPQISTIFKRDDFENINNRLIRINNDSLSWSVSDSINGQLLQSLESYFYLDYYKGINGLIRLINRKKDKYYWKKNYGKLTQQEEQYYGVDKYSK